MFDLDAILEAIDSAVEAFDSPDGGVRFGATFDDGALTEDDVIVSAAGDGYVSPSDYYKGVNGIPPDPE